MATILGAILMSSSAFAQVTISQTQSFNFTPNGSQSLTFNKINGNVSDFNDILDITISIVFTKTGGSLSVDNDSAESGEVTFTHTLAGALNQGSGPALIDSGFSTGWAAVNAISSTTQFLEATTGDPTDEFNNTGLGDFYRFDPDPVTVASSSSIASAVWGQYFEATGPGTFSWNFSANQLTDATGLGGLQQALTVSQAQGTVTVEYSLIPEPGTIVLATIMFGSLGGLHLLKRRKK